MNKTVGMLWFDNDPKSTPADKIRKAAKHYRETRSVEPSIAFVNPAWNKTSVVDGIEVKAIRSVPPNNIWIGVYNGKTQK